MARTVADVPGTRPAGGRRAGAGHLATAPVGPPSGAAPPERPVDGRAARGERTRRAVAEALLSLIEEGDLRPTARAVAARAGVSLRIVFHHFEDMDALLRRAAALMVERHWSKVRPVDSSLPTAEKVTRVVRQRGAVFDAVTPVRRAATLVAHSSPTLEAEFAWARRGLRAVLAEVFRPELDAAGDRRTELLNMLEVGASWETWDQLRRPLGHNAAAARRVMAGLLNAALASCRPA